MEPPRSEPLLRFEDASRMYRRGNTEHCAVDGVSLDLQPGECIAVVGESGSGKSTLLRMALGLCAPTRGRVLLDGSDWAAMSGRERRHARARLGIVFQEPYESLDPSWSVAEIVAEPLRLQHGLGARACRTRVLEQLDAVGLGSRFADAGPGELSGGQQQRVGLARALVTGPEAILLDEPTSALDLSVQAQILDLLCRIRQSSSLAMLLVTHDLNVAGFIADRIVVMRNGRLLECGPTEEVFGNPQSDYTRELLNA